MAVSQKIALGVLLVSLFFMILSYLPARHGVHWMIRVAGPEWGWLVLMVGLWGGAWLARGYPKSAATASAVLVVLALLPWWQALRLASRLPAEMKAVFPKTPERHPLTFGPQESHVMTTETFKEGRQWDRYTPAQPIARLLFIHGGSWRNGTRGDYPQLFKYLADRGFEVVSVTYTLSGEAPYPAAPDDIEAAIDKAYDPDLPLFVAGRSSGGHLALLGSYRQPEKIKGVIAFYAPVDLQWSYDNPSNPYVLNSPEAIEEFMDGPPSDLYREASPIHQLTESGPPTLMIHGHPDCLVYHRQSEMLSEKLAEHRVRHYLLSLPWAEHGGDVHIQGPSGRLSAWAMECFMNSELER